MKVFENMLLLALAATALGCADAGDTTTTTLTAADSLAMSVDGREFSRHIAVLAHDSLEGRRPFTNGEVKTITYLSAEFSRLGLSPGNGDSFFQEVPLVEIGSKVRGEMVIKGGKQTAGFKPLDDFVATSRHMVPRVKLKDSELVFAGYGIVAPEFGWDDYAGLDVKGKTVIVMVNDPGFSDSTLFRGKNMTYYGRWTYKYEEAARQGAAGVLIIHDTAPASYGWNVVRSGWGKSKLYLQRKDGNAARALMEGWLTMESARALLKQADVAEDILKNAGQKGFKPVPLNLTLSVEIENTMSRSVSHNVLALWPGTDRKEEYIIYTAHWDHFGVGEKIDGDSIYNGAVDNATGTAALLEIAKAFTKGKSSRSILFLAVTAEEQGLLGSEHYASNPVYPPGQTVAVINVDVLQPFGRMKDVVVVGKGQSELDEYVDAAARKQDRYTRAEPDPSAGSYFRSDHFNFAKIGIPALYMGSGTISREHGEEWGEKMSRDYNEKRYHAPSDNYSPDWDISGIIEDIRLLFEVGYRLSNESVFPKWKTGSEFKEIRENSV